MEGVRVKPWPANTRPSDLRRRASTLVREAGFFSRRRDSPRSSRRAIVSERSDRTGGASRVGGALGGKAFEVVGRVVDV